jgi:hypothetical protein
MEGARDGNYLKYDLCRLGTILRETGSPEAEDQERSMPTPKCAAR